MNRRTFCSFLPFAGALAASPILTVPKTTVYVHDLTLTRQKVVVFDLDGKTYGLKMTDEYIEDVTSVHEIHPFEFILRFVQTVTGGTVTLERRSGVIPEFEDVTCTITKYYIRPDEPMQTGIRYRRMKYGDKYMCYFKVTIEAGHHNLFWYLVSGTTPKIWDNA